MGLAQLLGIRRRFKVESVRYRECTHEPLRRALSPKGTGTKAFDVTFADGASMRIETTPRRRFADLSGPGILDPYRCGQSVLRPGMRIVLLESGTGAAGAWAARLVGQAGAVVALDRDVQSIEYAARRYPLPNISFEVGGAAALNGETDGSFDAALAIDAFAADDDPVPSIAELWRVLAPGGAMVLAVAMDTPPEPDHRRRMSPDELAVLVEAALRGGEAPEQVSISRRRGWSVAVIRRQSEE
jgi:SAM-dependent methyltransferase